MRHKEKKEKPPVDLIFTGCMFLGMGVGFLTGAFLPGMFIGMGVGFIVMALVKFNNKPENIMN